MNKIDKIIFNKKPHLIEWLYNATLAKRDPEAKAAMDIGPCVAFEGYEKEAQKEERQAANDDRLRGLMADHGHSYNAIDIQEVNYEWCKTNKSTQLTKHQRH